MRGRTELAMNLPPSAQIKGLLICLGMVILPQVMIGGTVGIEWTKLAPIPDAEGFAGSFAGVHGGSLIVAGGANFPEAKPWEGGTKRWHDRVFVLSLPGAAWRESGRLPMPLAYGVSITTADGLICVGGSNAEGHQRSVIRLRLVDGEPSLTLLPSLPVACANLSGALLGETIYVAGGTENPESVEALRSVWALDLRQIGAGWEALEPLPGCGRILAAAGAVDGSFFVVGGSALKLGKDGKTEREGLRDGYRYTPGRGWRPIADAPRNAYAAPSPMPVTRSGALLLLGGDDGRQISRPLEEHRGFPNDAAVYDASTDTWTVLEHTPFALVTTPTVLWESRIVIPGGERKPGIRSTEVWAGAILDKP